MPFYSWHKWVYYTYCIKKIVTNLAVLDIKKGQFVLKEHAPGVSIEEIKAATDGDLLIPDSVSEMDLD